MLLGASSIVRAQSTSQSSGEILTNENIVKMVKANLSPIIIISKIRTSKTQFNLSTDELIRLQKERVPDDIIKAMVDASSSESSRISQLGAGDTTRTDPNDPRAPHEAGIYLYEEKNGERRMVQLEPSVSKQSKTGGFFGSEMTMGVKKIKVKAALAGRTAGLQLDTPRPIFYFYFEVKNSGLNSANSYATSPNDFVLVKFDTKENTREVTVSQANVFGAQSGTMDKAARAFSLEKISPGVYKVTPQADLDDGEYGFYNGAGAGPSGGTKIFDFGIKLPR